MEKKFNLFQFSLSKLEKKSYLFKLKYKITKNEEKLRLFGEYFVK